MSGSHRQTSASLQARDYLSEVQATGKPLALSLSQTPEQARKVLSHLMGFRRMVHSAGSCKTSTCESCSAPHLSKAKAAISQNKPITFILPAFPGKSPNPSKVLGVLPDMAERKALIFLNGLCEQLGRIYSPGAKIIICSDGRVFSDVVGMDEKDVTAYQDHLEETISELSLRHISTFNLDILSEGQNFDEVRKELMHQYGQSLESLREKVRRGGKEPESTEDVEAHRMYCGITRFLFEDSLTPDQTMSRTALQKACRARAYEVIRRSNAWSELLAEQFPEAIRLSIHPQACGSRKLGIQLLGTDSWMTPWHGVAVDTGEGFVLMKRWEAEKLNLKLMRDENGRASHFYAGVPLDSFAKGRANEVKN